eukprot:scaffold11596_cov128-Isochrysis_galbana.AAC.5
MRNEEREGASAFSSCRAQVSTGASRPRSAASRGLRVAARAGARAAAATRENKIRIRAGASRAREDPPKTKSAARFRVINKVQRTSTSLERPPWTKEHHTNTPGDALPA